MTTATPIPNSTLDQILTAQLIVAWAGESGEEPRLKWWRTDLVTVRKGATQPPRRTISDGPQRKQPGRVI